MSVERSSRPDGAADRSRPSRSLARELLLTLTFALIAVAALAWKNSQRSARSDRPILAANRTEKGLASPVLADLYRSGSIRGVTSAPVQVVEFGSFTCSFCYEFAALLDTLDRRYPGAIALRWVHAVSPGAAQGSPEYLLALASECFDEQGRFSEFHDAVLLQRRSLSDRVALIEFAGEVKVNDLTLFLACLDGSEAHESIEGEWRLAERLKVTGTPTLLVNGQRFEGVPSLVQLDSVVLARLRQ